jgi:hypothetical protein
VWIYGELSQNKDCSCMSLHLLNHHEIDFQKWDETIYESYNGRVYALSWYLNEMAPGWKAVVAPDYSTIMPLPVRKKWGIEYLFQPAFIQQLGLFSKTDIHVSVFDEWLKTVSRHYRYVEINANSKNQSHLFKSVLRKNYLLPLQNTYEEIRKFYSRSAIRNMKKAIEYPISIHSSEHPEELLQLHQQRYGTNLAKQNEYIAFSEVLKSASRKQLARFYYAQNPQAEIIASSGYLLFKNRITFIINGNTPESFTNGATHLLKDYVIKEFSGSNWVMDFEGSDTPSFARFYEQYGASATDNYPFFKINRLPLAIKWFKQ